MAFSTISSRPVSARFATSTSTQRPKFVARQVSGRTEPFNENVAQVKRLINRDRKEFMGNSEDILDKYTTEFGDGLPTPTFTPAPVAPTPAPASPTPSAVNPFAASSLSAENPFKTPAATPFGAAPAAPKPFKQGIEPKGLTPDMSPDPIIKETPFDLIKSIGLPQIIIFCTFSSMIGLMIATFWVVVNAGGVSLAGLD